MTHNAEPIQHIEDTIKCRIYVHDLTFLNLASNAPNIERDIIVNSLVCSRAMRVSFHMITVAADIGLLDQQVANSSLKMLRRHLYQPITTLLKRMYFLPSNIVDSRGPSAFQLALLPQQRIMASCFEAGYWTFATTKDAAARMYGDSESLRHLYSAQAANRGPADLRMIRGDNVGLNEPPSHKRTKIEPISFMDWRRLHHDQAGSVARGVADLLDEELSCADHASRSLATDISGCIGRLWKIQQNGRLVS